MIWLFDQVGYVGLLGLSRLIVWMPLILFLVHRLPRIPIPYTDRSPGRSADRQERVSLISDSLDVIRNLLCGTT